MRESCCRVLSLSQLSRRLFIVASHFSMVECVMCESNFVRLVLSTGRINASKVLIHWSGSLFEVAT